MIKSPLVQKIEDIITPTVESMGFEIVRISLIGSSNPTLQIMAERPEDGKINLDECGKLSQAISAILDVENTMEDQPYLLDVGSPGIDRPLTRLKDFERYSENNAKLELENAIDGRKRFKGCLKGVKEDNVIILVEDEEISLPFSAITKASLTISEDLLKPKQYSKTKKETK